MFKGGLVKFNIVLGSTNIESYLYIMPVSNQALKGLNLCFWVPGEKQVELTRLMADVTALASIKTSITLLKSQVATSPQCNIHRIEYSYNFEDTIEKIDLIVSKFGFKLKL